jgi:hypothetical protein
MAKKKDMGPDMMLAILGVIAWIVAIGFGLDQRAFLTRDAYAPNITAAGAACGFAVAGGLCFLGAALYSRIAPEKPVPPTESFDKPDTKN